MFGCLVDCRFSFIFLISAYWSLVLSPLHFPGAHIEPWCLPLTPTYRIPVDINIMIFQTSRVLIFPKYPALVFFNRKLMGEPSLAPVEIHAQLKFVFSGINEPRTTAANTCAPAETDSDHWCLLNIGFVICSVSSLKYVCRSHFPLKLFLMLSEWGIDPKELDSSTWKVQSTLRHHWTDGPLGLLRLLLRHLGCAKDSWTQESGLIACNDFSYCTSFQKQYCAKGTPPKCTPASWNIGWEEG